MNPRLNSMKQKTLIIYTILSAWLKSVKHSLCRLNKPVNHHILITFVISMDIP